ncbi:MAG: hypothetical protein WAL71_12405 [Terriglobales bacterium]
MDKTTLEQQTKNDHKNSRRSILQSALRGTRMETLSDLILGTSGISFQSRALPHIRRNVRMAQFLL